MPVAPAGQYYQRLYRVSPPGPAGVGAPFFLGHRLASVALPGSLAPVTSLEPRGQHSVLCQPQPGLAPAASPQNSSCWRRVPAPLIAGLSSEFYSSLILTHLGCTMVIENSIRTRLSEIVNLNLFKSSENNNVRKSTQSKHNQKLVTNPSEETFVSNQSTAKLLKVINIIIN